jgi:hypothetical protein
MNKISWLGNAAFFIGDAQAEALRLGLLSDEGAHFALKLEEIRKLIEGMYK